MAGLQSQYTVTLAPSVFGYSAFGSLSGMLGRAAFYGRALQQSELAATASLFSWTGNDFAKNTDDANYICIC